ncbi:MAG: hypothetical protein KJO50_05745 [Bacteroidia bacterium]|nr:hypothetical protein [Bacteroidia bacterium]
MQWNKYLLVYMRDLKYLAAYTVPLLSFISLKSSCIFTFSTPVFVFVAVLLPELFLPSDKSKLPSQQSESKAKNIFVEILLYLNIPLVFDHHETAKQLPFGYPTAMLVSLLPPLWFKLMNIKI